MNNVNTIIKSLDNIYEKIKYPTLYYYCEGGPKICDSLSMRRWAKK